MMRRIVSIAFIVVMALQACTDNEPLRYLPIYGPTDENNKTNHKVQDFSLTNQEGKTVTQKDLNGRVYVTDFFFTTCHNICPIMSGQMERVYNKYKDNNTVMFLSHSVNPEFDSVPVLAKYAAVHHADAKKWFFVTGDKKQIYDLARNSYLVTATEGDGGPDDFVHTQNFALVDKDKRIRGYYDGTDSTDVEKLMLDMDLLLQEYAYKEKHKE